MLLAGIFFFTCDIGGSIVHSSYSLEKNSIRTKKKKTRKNLILFYCIQYQLLSSQVCINQKNLDAQKHKSQI